MADEPTPTAVEPEPKVEPQPTVDPLESLKQSWQAQTNAILEKLGALESRVATAERPAQPDIDPGSPFVGLKTPEEIRAKVNELFFQDPTSAFDAAFNIKAGPIVAETRAAQGEIARKAAFVHPVYGPLLEDDAIKKDFEEGWASLSPEQRIYERSAVGVAAYAVGKHPDIIAKRAAEAERTEASKRAPVGHTHPPSAPAQAPKEPVRELTPEEKDVARKLGITEADYQANLGR